MIIGAEYNPQKVAAHRKDLAAVRDAARNLGSLLSAVDRQMRV
jgi:hypothetical protein